MFDMIFKIIAIMSVIIVQFGLVIWMDVTLGEIKTEWRSEYRNNTYLSGNILIAMLIILINIAMITFTAYTMVNIW